MAAPIHPKGAKSDKIWREALMRAVRRLGDDPIHRKGTKAQRLDLLAEAVVAKGLKGDVPAIREIGDRLDGKPTQGIELAPTEGFEVLLDRITRGSSKAA